MFWTILEYIDLALFIVMSLTVAYMGVFAIFSQFSRHSATPKSKRENRFIILIPAYRSGPSVLKTVKSILGQTYAQRLFDVTVISDHVDEMTNFQLAQQPVTLLTPNFEKSAKSKSLQLAINNLPQFKIYDIVIILNAGNVVEPEFLAQMNEAYEAAGTKAIQSHRISYNRDTVSARLNATFEEINNSVFRRGHIAVGLSAALSDSGMAYSFNWFKENIKKIQVSTEDKEMEAMLARQHVYVDYFDNIYVYDEKSRLAEDFNREHTSWVKTQLRTILRNIQYLPLAILNRQYDLADKIVQWLLIPRMVLMLTIMFMGVVVPFFYMSLAFKWWALFAVVLLIFAIATPNYLVDDKWDRTFFSIPLVLLNSVLKRFKLGKKLQEHVNKLI